MTFTRKRSKNARRISRTLKAASRQSLQQVKCETLELRQLLATVNVADFGAVPNDGQNDTAAIQNAINASAPGDTIQFNAGRYDIGEILIRSNRTYRGMTGAVVRSSSADIAWRLEHNAANIAITGLRLEGSGGAFLYMGNGGTYRNISITGNTFADMNGQAIKMMTGSDQVTIERNTFTNIRGYGTTLAFFTNRLTYRFNRFIDVAHGGHFLAPLNDCVFAYNHMTGLTNMGLEIQSHGGSVARNMIVEGNVIHDWRSTHSHAMGLSVPTSWSVNTTIRDNYINGNLAPGHTWLNVPGRHPSIGTMIEAIYDSGVVRNNVVGGTYYFCVGAGTSNAPPTYTSVIEGNRFYGSSVAGVAHISGWPGAPRSPAGWSTGSGNQAFPADQMPGPDAWIRRIAEVSGQPGSIPNPPPAPTPPPQPAPTPAPTPNPVEEPSPQPTTTIDAPSDLAGKALSTKAIELSWKDNSDNEVAFHVERRDTRGKPDWVTVQTLKAGTTKYVDQDLNPSWEYDYRIVAVAEDDSTARGEPITVMTLIPPPSAPAPTPVVSQPPPTENLPNAVGRLAGYPLSSQQIRIIWQDTNRNETGYRVERRSSDSSSWRSLRTLPAGAKVYVDKKLSADTSYEYRIVAINSYGEKVSASIAVKTMLSDPTDKQRLHHLTAMPMVRSSNGLGRPEVNRNNGGARSKDGGMIAINGQGYYRGIGVWSSSELRYTLDGKYSTFLTDVGVDDWAGKSGSVVFQVYADGEKLYDSGTVRGGEAARQVSVPVAGKKELWLVVTDAGDSATHDMANWANPRLAAA